jgi:hypothetical protein
MRKRAFVVVVVSLLSAHVISVGRPVSSGQSPTIATSSHTAAMTDSARARISETYGKLPLHFEANLGQIDGQVKFLTRGPGYTMFLTANEAVIALSGPQARERNERHLVPPGAEPREPVSQTVLRMSFPGANRKPRVEGRNELPGKANYFRGKDPAKWRSNVPTFAQVHYQDVYPDIDLVYYGNQRELEYDFVVRPGGDPASIALAFEGADKLEVDAAGDLVLHANHETIRQRKPIIYQEIDGVRREIAGDYHLTDKHQAGIHVAAYDPSRPLIIDPVLVYSTYLGGDHADHGSAIAVDSAGNAYVTGRTDSTNFPSTAGAFQTTFVPHEGGSTPSLDVFVTKLNPTGSELVYSTYLGSPGADEGNSIAVDTAGNAYIAGDTNSSDFPTTTGAFQLSGWAFVTKLNSAGSALLYSTYVGGSNFDRVRTIAVDATGSAYVTGTTESTDFPTSPGAFDTTYNGGIDTYVMQLNASGSALVYATYLGGISDDYTQAIAIDGAGNAYVTGYTTSVDFPTTLAALDTTHSIGQYDGFVTKLNASGSALVFSTYLGGSVDNSVSGGIAVDAAGGAYVTGFTESIDFPVSPLAFQIVYGGGGSDGFIAKLNPTGSGLIYATYLGGIESEEGQAIAVDSDGNAYVVGSTDSTDFPTTPGAFQPTPGGGVDAFVAKLNPAGSALLYSSYLGGSDTENARGIAIDTQPDPNAYVTGLTFATDFPTSPGAFQPTYGGGSFIQNGDGFVSKIAYSGAHTPAGINVTVSLGGGTGVAGGASVTFSSVIVAGETEFGSSSTGPPPPSGFQLGTPPTYANLSTTAVFAGPVEVCLNFSGVSYSDPSELRLFHFEGGAWADVTVSLDTVNSIVCGSVTSLSPFAVVEPSDGTLLTSLGPVTVWIGLKNSDAAGIWFDLRAEFYRNGTELVGSGQLNSVPGGSSGFNNAHERVIDVTFGTPVSFLPGDTLNVTLLVRNACTGSGKNSGIARLWYNDAGANSRFIAEIGTPTTIYLVNGFGLSLAPGSGPKKTADVAAGSKCSPFKAFGTWSGTR